MVVRFFPIPGLATLRFCDRGSSKVDWLKTDVSAYAYCHIACEASNFSLSSVFVLPRGPVFAQYVYRLRSISTFVYYIYEPSALDRITHHALSARVVYLLRFRVCHVIKPATFLFVANDPTSSSGTKWSSGAFFSFVDVEMFLISRCKLRNWCFNHWKVSFVLSWEDCHVTAQFSLRSQKLVTSVLHVTSLHFFLLLKLL